MKLWCISQLAKMNEMSYQAAVSVAATARAMGFENVRIDRDTWGRRCVTYLCAGGNWCVHAEDRVWRRRRLDYRGPRRRSNTALRTKRRARRGRCRATRS